MLPTSRSTARCARSERPLSSRPGSDRARARRGPSKRGRRSAAVGARPVGARPVEAGRSVMKSRPAGESSPADRGGVHPRGWRSRAETQRALRRRMRGIPSWGSCRTCISCTRPWGPPPHECSDSPWRSSGGCVLRHRSRASSPYRDVCPCLMVGNRPSVSQLAYAPGNWPFDGQLCPGGYRSGSGSLSQLMSSAENPSGSSSWGKCPRPSKSRQR